MKVCFVSKTLPPKTFSEWISHHELPDVCISLHYFFRIVSVNAYFSPIIACASTCSHSWKGTTGQWRETDIYILGIQLLFLQRTTWKLHTMWIYHRANCLFLSTLQFHWTRSGVTSELSTDKSSWIPFFPLFGLGVLSLHSRSSKTCLIFTIQVPVKVKPEDLNSL